MLRVDSVGGIIVLVVLMVAASAAADILEGAEIKEVAKCQKGFAVAGANFAKRVIRANLKCTTAISLCQVQCEFGVFGPPCSANPPPCCDPDDLGSNATFAACMGRADGTCMRQAANIDNWEASKQINIVNACSLVTTEELCGAETPGLNFRVLATGCAELNPGFTCSLWDVIDCVGGPLERQLADQITALLDPRAGDAISMLGLEDRFPGIPRERKVRDTVAAGTLDVWAVDGLAGEEFSVRVDTRNDDGDGTTGLQPLLSLLDRDGETRVDDTKILEEACPVASTCGGTCPLFTRRLPFSGTFYISVGAQDGVGCTGGKYKLVVRSPRGSRPTLVADDVPPGTFEP